MHAHAAGQVNQGAHDPPGIIQLLRITQITIKGEMEAEIRVFCLLVRARRC